MSLPLIVLLLVLTLIAIRRIGRLRLAIWQIMSAGAFSVLAGGAIEPGAAWRAIDGEVMLFLFGVFVVGQATVESGVLAALTGRLVGRCRTADGLLLAWIYGAGLASALLMNDTLAVVGTPLALKLAERFRLPPPLMLLALAFAVTTGSVLSPIGNPQNLLIALGGRMGDPFVTFLERLWFPSLAALLLVYLLLRHHFRSAFADAAPAPWPISPEAPAADRRYVRLTWLALALLVGGVLLRVVLTLSQTDVPAGLAWIALTAAAPLILLAPRRAALLRRIDWHTLIFFAALFVLMASVWATAEVQAWIADGARPRGTASVYLSALGLSQLLSNVPLVSLMLPWLLEGGADAGQLLALAAGSTLAGNLFLIGAASNVIVVQGAERLGVTLGFFQFARIGIPLTVAQSLVFLLWL